MIHLMIPTTILDGSRTIFIICNRDTFVFTYLINKEVYTLVAPPPLLRSSLLTAHSAGASGPLVLTHGPERRRSPPGQARRRRQRPHALLRRRGQRRPALLGTTAAVLQHGITGRQGYRRWGSLSDEFVDTSTTPFFSCTTAAPAAEAEAHSRAPAADWVSQRGIRERYVHFL